MQAVEKNFRVFNRQLNKPADFRSQFGTENIFIAFQQLKYLPDIIPVRPPTALQLGLQLLKHSDNFAYPCFRS
jgi:hypothetical protein